MGSTGPDSQHVTQGPPMHLAGRETAACAHSHVCSHTQTHQCAPEPHTQYKLQAHGPIRETRLQAST